MSSDSQWHAERRKQILEKYPEIKHYFGNYSLSVAYIICLDILQWLVAWWVADKPWWFVGLVAFFVGQFILHSLATFIHEAAHNLILKGKYGSLYSLFLIDLGSLSFGQSLKYISQHGPSHHLHLNDYEKDYELWDKAQSEFLRTHPFWRGIQALLQLLPGGLILGELVIERVAPTPDKTRKLKEAKQPSGASTLLLLTSLTLYALAWIFLGWKAALYLFWSLTLTMSNWGITFTGQSISEHHIEQKGKTYSTYHWTNILFFNTGYHDEHHTFPNVAWVHLPKIKQIAPEYFTNDSPYSYFRWWWRWASSIFDPVRYHRYFPEPSRDRLPVSSEPQLLTK
jgi:sphingolipid 4-desaturase/C4-monooxygenase